MSTLPELIAECSALVRELAERGLDEEMSKRLSQVEIAIPEKLDRYYFMDERMKYEAKFFKEKADEYRAIAESIEKARQFRRQRVKEAIMAVGTGEVFGNEVRWKLSKAAPKLVIDDVDQLKKEYIVEITTYEPIKNHIIDDLRSGKQVKGAHLEEVLTLRAYPNRS